MVRPEALARDPAAVRCRRRCARAIPCIHAGAELDLLLEAIGASDDVTFNISAIATLGAELLRWHYDLGDDDLDELLVFRPADPASFDSGPTVVEIATGRCGPKSGDGGA